MPLAHGAGHGHTGGSWDKSWFKGIEQHVADASGPVAAGLNLGILLDVYFHCTPPLS